MERQWKINIKYLTFDPRDTPIAFIIGEERYNVGVFGDISDGK